MLFDAIADDRPQATQLRPGDRVIVGLSRQLYIGAVTLSIVRLYSAREFRQLAGFLPIRRGPYAHPLLIGPNEHDSAYRLRVMLTLQRIRKQIHAALLAQDPSCEGLRLEPHRFFPGRFVLEAA